jgi:outer membrane protein OmpA-like peptidoglycan-associated protein
MRATLIALSLVCSCAHPAVAPPGFRLDRVVLFQNGIGHFERSGALPERHLRLLLRPQEVDDVIKTLTVVDRAGHAQQVAAVLPTPDQNQRDRVVIDIELSQPVADLIVSYAVPTATWKTTYRVALPDKAGAPLLFQAWAMIDNVSEESWDHVQLSLATGAPLSYATDLRTPHFVPRPDATGALVSPTATGIARADHTRGDRSVDSDHDGIVDADDRCPNDDENYNGFDDEDGCPDRGRVLVSDNEIQILDRVYFGAGVIEPPPEAMPIIDAIAATLIGNPQISSIAINGHAAVSEGDPWGLSARRAGAIRALLLARGVNQVLTIRPFGDSQPSGGKVERDRRVEFDIDRTPPVVDAPLTAQALSRSAGNTAATIAVAARGSGQRAEWRFDMGLGVVARRRRCRRVVISARRRDARL